MNGYRSVTELDSPGAQLPLRDDSRAWRAHLTTATSTGHITHPTTSFPCRPNIGASEVQVNPEHPSRVRQEQASSWEGDIRRSQRSVIGQFVGFANHSFSCFRIERIPQPVAQQVESKNRCEYGGSWVGEHPRRTQN